ncbi:MAG: phospholipase D family protein [Thermoproteota archaeon]|nr:phospholipase D family protein [Thermoproteota archaeon]
MPNNTPSKNSIFSADQKEVIYGAENVVKRTLHLISITKKTLDLCGESAGLSTILANESIVKRYMEAKNRGVRVRHITEITQGNIRDCKKLMGLMDIRHLDGLRGYLVKEDGEIFVSQAYEDEGKWLPHMVISSASVLVEQQQYFFELLWNKAIPAKQRIREIEEGAKREFVETIREPSEIQKVGFDLIKAAEEEILIIFSTDNAFYRQIRAGILQLLKEAVVRGVKIRMLVPMNKKMRNEIAGEIQELGIDIRDSKKSLLAKITTLVVDNTLSLTIQLNDGPEETSEDEDEEEERDIVLATYSNSESIVLTYLSIFENMWVHQHGKEEQQKRKTLQSQHL